MSFLSLFLIKKNIVMDSIINFNRRNFSKNIENDRYASFSIKPFIAIIYSLLMKNNKLPKGCNIFIKINMEL